MSSNPQNRHFKRTFESHKLKDTLNLIYFFIYLICVKLNSSEYDW